MNFQDPRFCIFAGATIAVAGFFLVDPEHLIPRAGIVEIIDYLSRRIDAATSRCSLHYSGAPTSRDAVARVRYSTSCIRDQKRTRCLPGAYLNIFAVDSFEATS